MADYYKILGVLKNASEDQLRKAYRQLAREFHPDVNPGNQTAEERFKEITTAYGVLSDPKKRQLYDEFGEVGLREGFNAEQARAYQAYGGGPARGSGAPDASARGNAGGFDLGEMFEDFFGGRRSQRPSASRGRDVLAHVELGFAEALQGTQVELRVPSHPEPVTVRIPAGAQHGAKLRVAAKGESGARGGPPGDLLIELRVGSHPYFYREGRDLILKLPITLPEAFLGTTLEIPTPMGAVNLKIKPLSQQGTRLRMRGKGFEYKGRRGDLYVELAVQVPDVNTEETTRAVQQLEQAYQKSVRDNLKL